MWVIRNLPDEYKAIGELWLKKFEIEKATKSLKDTIEELHAYIIQTEDDAETKRALSDQHNKNKNKTSTRCSNNSHNPLAQHSKEDCWKLHPEKLPKSNKPIKALMARKDTISISHLTTAPYTPKPYPFARRGNQTTITKTRCLLKDSGLDLSLLAEAENTAIYLENITPSKNMNFDTPFHKWFNKEPSLRHLQPFCFMAIMLEQKQNGKFDETGSRGIFLGYGETQQSYRIMDPGRGNIKINHHVKCRKT
ncbi:hypothetical protein O181_021293 [Austropuccinia psidii MF-1]|uniref:Retroviral polymerase SH3-like domain-containing protein n=1 Tax=Austropuccinia psidii MF-1 TaxID=1389203 RepID=A0A9Q3CD44_9BASI|nr:hypothetical protein [Austropuccinia psidii MF-1]